MPAQVDPALKTAVETLWARDAATARVTVDRALRYSGVERISQLDKQRADYLLSEVNELLSLPF